MNVGNQDQDLYEALRDESISSDRPNNTWLTECD